MATKPHASKTDYRDAFGGLLFPTSKAAIVNKTRDQGGIDGEVYAIVSQLPGRSYDSLEDLQEAVRALYQTYGVAADDLPL